MGLKEASDTKFLGSSNKYLYTLIAKPIFGLQQKFLHY